MDNEQIELHRAIRIFVNRDKVDPIPEEQMKFVRVARALTDQAVLLLPPSDARRRIEQRIQQERHYYPHHAPIPTWLKEMAEKLQINHLDTAGSDPYKNVVHAIDLLCKRSGTPAKKLAAIRKMIGDINNVQEEDG